jgi:hypothetical protein
MTPPLRLPLRGAAPGTDSTPRAEGNEPIKSRAQDVSSSERAATNVCFVL